MGAVTISSTSYSVYGDEAGANAYLAARLGADSWASATATARAQALVSATRSIQNWLASRGVALDPATSTETEVAEANYDFAFLLTQDSTQLDATTTTTNERKLKAGSAEIEYFRPIRGGRFPASVQLRLNNWLTATGNAAGLGMAAYGTCNRTSLRRGAYEVVGTISPSDTDDY